MRATLYEALGIPQAASDAEVRSALRGQIRKYYAKTRDGHGNVEEALRFINHASRILSDPELRAQYDHDLEASGAPVDERIAHVVGAVAAAAGRDDTPLGAAGAASSSAAARAGRAAGPDTGSGKAHHPALTERVTAVRPSPAVTVSLCVLFAVFIALAIAVATPADALQAAKQVLIGLTVSLLALTVIYGMVHGIAWTRRRSVAAPSALVPPPDVAILNWRRQKSVFLGTNEPQEDASWVFRLRMAELDRAKLGRTSEPRPWSRLCARLFDYALWGLVLALPLAELRALGIVGAEVADWLAHPLLAPILITASWIPVEAALVAALHATPGKWLFGVYLQLSISDAYAAGDAWTRFRHALMRALRVWWSGMGCGFPLLAPFLIAASYERVAEYQETSWDFAEDCLVTHGPVEGLNAVTGGAGLAAMLWLYGVAWHQPMGESIARARAGIVAAVPSPAALLADRFRRDGNTAGTLASGDRTPGGVVPRAATPAAVRPSPGNAAHAAHAAAGAPLDPELAALFAERNQRVARLRAEGPRLLEAGSYRRAAAVCREWADLELGNARAWRCLGLAQQALGSHRDAVGAFRKAKQYDPGDGTLDAAIGRSQRAIVVEFQGRRGN